MTEYLHTFRDALAGRGILPPDDLRADGKLHRCDAAGPGGKGDAAYLLHGDGIPAGGFENWRDGHGWQNWRAEAGRPLTPAEAADLRARTEAARQAREAEDSRRKAEARERACLLWAEAVHAHTHPYLTRKGIDAHGARLHGEALVLPLRDTAGALHSLQFIAPDGTKRFLGGGRVRGCYFAIGVPHAALCIAEGFATAASIRQATGHAVAVAFDAGNLLPVARALRERFPDLPLLLCADDDCRSGGNPGLTRAREAAEAVGGLLAVPDFGKNRPDEATDFNDLFRLHGAQAVKRCIDVVLNPRSPEAAESRADMPETPMEPEESSAENDRATCSYGSGRFEVSSRGVFFTGTDKDGNEQPPRWICAPLTVCAKTRDDRSGAWGRLLEWRDDDGVRHQWAMPLELLQGDGSDVRRELTRLGLAISPNRTARDLLASYLQVWPVETRACCVERLGWHRDVYVTPEETVGQKEEIVVFQNHHAQEPAFSTSGGVGEWRASVAALARGNSRLVFAVSSAFAGTLAEVAGEESGGFHFRGGSSSGKTTALKAAASVWGDPAVYSRLWRATANGLEGLAALHNDGLLVLDELSQIDPRDAGEAAYLLANGQGKTRASRSGTARQSARWRLLFLSAGEESLTALMARSGRKTNAGQEIRLADIDADAGAGMGSFETLNGQPTPAALALAVKEAAAGYHGAVGQVWLRRVVAERRKLPGFLEDGMRRFVAEVVPGEASGQVLRVARRFALVALAGELAGRYGLTGWNAGEADAAARKCFSVWLEGFGPGNREERTMLAQVRGFFEAHGASRFEDMAAVADQRVPNRAGFYRTGADGTREYLVLPKAYRDEVCQGFDARAVTAVLLKAGWLMPGEDKRGAPKLRLPGLGATRCYLFTARMWEWGGD